MKILKNVFVDLPMFLTRNSFTGDLNIRKDSLAIKESLKNIILTIFNERPFDPEFGTNVMLSLFENPSDFSFYVENSIATAIERYEPRVKLVNITNTFEGRSLTILIEVKILGYEIYDQLSFTMDSTRFLKIPNTPTTRNQIWAASWIATDPSVAVGTIAPESIGNVNTFDFVKPMIHVFDCVGNGAFNLSTAQEFITGANGCTTRFSSTISKLMELPAGKRTYHWKRYQNGPIYENPLDLLVNGEQSPWAVNSGVDVQNDLSEICVEMKNLGAEPDYMVFASEHADAFRYPFASSAEWTSIVFGITSSGDFDVDWFGSKSFSDTLNDDGNFAFNISNIVNAVNHPQTAKDYLYWDSAVRTLHAAYLNKFAFNSPIKEVFSGVKCSNYNSFLLLPTNEGYDQNGHPYYYGHLAGDGGSPEMYAGWNADGVYGVFNDDPTRIVRTNFSTRTTALSNNAWSQLLLLLQRYRAIKRDMPNTPLRPWIASKDFTDSGAGFNCEWKKDPISEKLYSEFIRHICLTGTEVLLLFNLTDNTVSKMTDTVSTINAILEDLNARFGGFTHSTNDTSRIDFKAKYVITGAPSSDGKHLWRVTPKPGILLKNSAGSLMITDEDGGFWISTDTSDIPVFEQYFSSSDIISRRGTDIVRRYYFFYSVSQQTGSLQGMNELSQRVYFGVPDRTFGEASAIGGSGITRAYPFEFNPANPAVSSPWHNMLYETFSEAFFSGFRAISIHFPFGGFNVSWLLQGLEWLNGANAFTSTTNVATCPARIKGFTGAVKQLLDGTMAPSGRPALNDFCDVHLYLPSASGWAIYRDKLHEWWTASAATNTARDAALIARLDEFVSFIASMKSDKGILSVTLDVGLLGATPDTLILHRSLKDYKSDACELANWYFYTKLNELGIPCLVESRPIVNSNRAHVGSDVGNPLPTGLTFGNVGITAFYGYKDFTSDESWMWFSDPGRAELDSDFNFSGADFFGNNYLRNGENTWTHRLHGSALTKGTRIPYGVTGFASYGGTAKDLFTYSGAPYTPHHAITHIYGCSDVYMDYLFRESGDGRWAERRTLKNFSTYAIEPYLMCGFRMIQPGTTSNQYTWWTNSLSFIPTMPIFGATGFTANASTYNGGFWTDTSKSFFNNSKGWFNTNIRGTTFGKQLSVFRDLCFNNSPPGAINPPNDTRGLTSWGSDIYYINTLDPIIRS